MIFKPLSFCFEETGFDVKAPLASRPVSRLIRWFNKKNFLSKGYSISRDFSWIEYSKLCPFVFKIPKIFAQIQKPVCNFQTVKETIGFDVKNLFASRPRSCLIRWYNKPGDIITKEPRENVIYFQGIFHGLKITNWNRLKKEIALFGTIAVDERYHIPKGGTIFREYSSILRHCETTVIFICLSPIQRLYQVKTCLAMSNVLLQRFDCNYAYSNLLTGISDNSDY